MSEKFKRYISCIKTKKTYTEYVFTECEAESEEIARAGMITHVKYYGTAPQHVIQVCESKRPKYVIDEFKEAEKSVETNPDYTVSEIANELYGEEVFISGFLSGVDKEAMGKLKELMNDIDNMENSK
jgi:hypothetical protein